MRLFLAGILFASMGYQAMASTNTLDKKYLTIASVQTKEIGQPEVITGFDIGDNKTTSIADQKCAEAEARGITPENLDLKPEDLNEFIAIGKRAWNFIVNNRPVVNVKTDSIAVVPVKAECWRFLEGWANPVARTYQTTFTNLYGGEVVKFEYKLLYFYGGNYKGAGRYLARVAILPSNLDVSWGYKFNASVTVPGVLNYGTVVNPIAGAELELRYSVDTVVKHTSSTVNVLVKGDGTVIEL